MIVKKEEALQLLATIKPIAGKDLESVVDDTFKKISEAETDQVNLTFLIVILMHGTRAASAYEVKKLVSETLTA